MSNTLLEICSINMLISKTSKNRLKKKKFLHGSKCLSSLTNNPKFEDTQFVRTPNKSVALVHSRKVRKFSTFTMTHL